MQQSCSKPCISQILRSWNLQNLVVLFLIGILKHRQFPWCVGLFLSSELVYQCISYAPIQFFFGYPLPDPRLRIPIPLTSKHRARAPGKWGTTWHQDWYSHGSLGKHPNFLYQPVSHPFGNRPNKRSIPTELHHIPEKRKILYFVWSPPWHLYILLLANLLAFYLTLYLAFYLAYLLAFYLAYLLAFYLTFYLAFYLAYLLAFYLAYLLAFYLAYLLAFYLAYLIAFYLAYLLAFYLAVEVQRCTLSLDVGEELGEELARQQWTWKWRQRWWRRCWRRRRRRRTTALIKSNNPHNQCWDVNMSDGQTNLWIHHPIWLVALQLQSPLPSSNQ